MADLRKLLDLPPRAFQTLWEVLGPCLGAKIPPAAESRLTELCKTHLHHCLDRLKPPPAERALLIFRHAYDISDGLATAERVGKLMPEPAANAARPLALHALGGGPAPAGMAADLQKILLLPASARQHFWEALGPSLSEPLHPEIEAQLDQFCRVHTIDDALLAPAIKACRFLIRRAAAIDLSRALFAEDLAQLAGSAPELAAILLAGYEEGKSFVRREILRSALLDHGKLLEGVSWRVERLTTSDRGDKLDARLVSLTLRYREGEHNERITMQVLPESIAELRAMCDALLSP